MVRGSIMKLPIWNNRELVGHASSVEGAKRVILGQQNYPNAVMTLSVWERPKYMQDLLDLPAGYVYAWHYHRGKDHA